MSNLALLGGQPVFASPLDWHTFWPPVHESTAQALQQLYYSRQWTAFDAAEPAFARAFAAHHGAKYGVFTLNGTISLHCALAALGVGRGDEVIVSPLTWYATALAVRHVGAIPVFVDIEPDTLCMDPAKMEAAITGRTKAVMVVHAYGSMADMERIVAVARRRGLKVIEDCAHMHGGAWNGRGIGTLGDVGSFSFQMCKVMSSGEGGICITNDAGLAERMFQIKQIGYGRGDALGRAAKPPPPGLLCYNFRATAFHPVILHEQLKGLDGLLERYGRAVRYLEERLGRSTQIRFQTPGKQATRQGYFGWLMLFDAPAYEDIPIEVIQQALTAEGLPTGRAEGPMYRFILFNLKRDEYRIDSPCTITQHVCARSLWLLHAYLGLEHDVLEKIAGVLEKVLGKTDELRSYAQKQVLLAARKRAIH
jgi:L-glutamine:2-deoxy-scyllo-inosose/3-amino-2,3-dideoxy-scyllo-inosose aminotransferase